MLYSVQNLFRGGGGMTPISLPLIHHCIADNLTGDQNPIKFDISTSSTAAAKCRLFYI